MTDDVLLEVRNVTKRYAVKGWMPFGSQEGRNVQALDDVSLSIRRGEVLGLVGESGSGKSTLGRIAAGLERASSGDVFFEMEKRTKAYGRTNRMRLLASQMIFQNAVASLNPRQRIKTIIGEPIQVHGNGGAVEAEVAELMERVGLAALFGDRRPRGLSGGQCQRVGIARALAVGPKFLICDEPVSALDVSIQAQVLNLFMDLREAFGYSYLFISHDLHVVERLSHRVAIMYLGRIVENGPTQDIFARPAHPYTQALIESAPSLDRHKRKSAPITGEIPSPLAPPKGCHFHPRCPMVMPVCRQVRPPLSQVGAGHWSACHLHTGPTQATTATNVTPMPRDPKRNRNEN